MTGTHPMPFERQGPGLFSHREVWIVLAVVIGIVFCVAGWRRWSRRGRRPQSARSCTARAPQLGKCLLSVSANLIARGSSSSLDK